MSAAALKMRRARGAAVAKRNPGVRISKRASASVRGGIGHLSRSAGGGFTAGGVCNALADGRAVVMTVTVIPETEQPPAGIEQDATRVGVVLKPLSLNWNVKVLPAEPVCVVCEGVTVGFAVNVAVTLVFALIAKVQTGFVLPAHAPDQLVKVEFASGTAVRVIEVPELKLVPEGVC
jgi:hypothetical protein